MKYLHATLFGLAVIIIGSVLLPIVLPDIVWGINISLFGGVAAGMAFYFWREHRLQQRVDEMIDDSER